MTQARLSRLRDRMANTHLDCVAVIAGPNLYYFTGLGFRLSERPTVAFFPRQGDPVIVAGVLEEPKVRSRSPYPMRGVYYTDAQGAQGMAEAFAQTSRLLKLGKARLGVETGRMRVMELQFVEEAFPDITVDSAEDLLAGLRMTKDADEIAHMRRAVQLAEAALEATLPSIHPGVTERQIAAELVVQTLRAGSDAELPFSPIVASGPNSALPHATVTDREIQAGDLLTLDWGAAWRGYFSDLTRTFAVGEISPELAGIYELVKAANAAGRQAGKPGVACKEVDAAARQVIAAGGYGEYFIHRVGHGLGLEGHEQPGMHGANDLPLEVGMTYTVEPGIYVPGKGGARIEDDVVVTENGAESLSGWTRELITLD